MIMGKGSPSIFVVGLGIGIIQQRLAEEKAYLEHLDLERVHRGDPSFNKTIEERIIWGELLELEFRRWTSRSSAFVRRADLSVPARQRCARTS